MKKTAVATLVAASMMSPAVAGAATVSSADTPSGSVDYIQITGSSSADSDVSVLPAQYGDREVDVPESVSVNTGTEVTVSVDETVYTLVQGDDFIEVNIADREVVVNNHISSFSDGDETVAVNDSVVYIQRLLEDIHNNTIDEYDKYVVGSESDGDFEDVLDEAEQGEIDQEVVNEAFYGAMQYHGIDEELFNATVRDVAQGEITRDTVADVVEALLNNNNLSGEDVEDLLTKMFTGNVKPTDVTSLLYKVSEGQTAQNMKEDANRAIDYVQNNETEDMVEDSKNFFSGVLSWFR